MTGLTVISFLFFGVLNLISPQDKEERELVEKDAFSLLEGNLTEEEKNLMKLFCAFPEAFFEQWLVKTGIAALVMEKHQELGEDIERRKVDLLSYQPYVHPHAPFLRLDQLWERFSPQFFMKYEKLRAKENSSKTALLLGELYCEANHISPTLMYNVMRYMEKQIPGTKQDYGLSPERLMLPNQHNLLEWLGAPFLSQLAHFVYEGAKMAQEKGVYVSSKEVEKDMEKYLEQDSSTKKISSYQAKKHLRERCNKVYLKEKAFFHAWKTSLLVEKFMKEVGQGVLVDHLFYDQIQDYAHQVVQVQEFLPPADLDFSSFQQMLQFQFYLDAVSPPPYARDLKKLPHVFYAIEEVKKHFPQLVHHKFSLEVAKVEVEELYGLLSLKEVRDWQISDKGWDNLKNQFPPIRHTAIGIDRKIFLYSQPEELQKRIDLYSFSQVVQLHPEWFEQKLKEKKREPFFGSIAYEGAPVLFPDFRYQSSFLIEKLQTLPLQEEAFFYGPDHTYYAVKVLEKTEEAQIMTFEEAKRLHVIEPLFTAYLEKKYKEIRKTSSSSFSNAKGEFKPLKEVQDQVGAIVYADLLKQIAEKEEDVSVIAKLRLKGFMAEQRLEQMAGFSAPVEKELSGLYHQWTIKSRENVIRAPQVAFEGNFSPTKGAFAKKEESLFQEALQLQPGEWSSLHVTKEGPLFFKVEKSYVDEEAKKTQLYKNQQKLSEEAQHLLAVEILQRG